MSLMRLILSRQVSIRKQQLHITHFFYSNTSYINQFLSHIYFKKFTILNVEGSKFESHMFRKDNRISNLDDSYSLE